MTARVLFHVQYLLGIGHLQRSLCIAEALVDAGIAVTLGNPKIMIFYLALLPSMLDLGHVRPLAWLELTITMLLVLISVDLAWVVLAVRARLFLTNRRAVKIANRSSAVVMVGAAAAIAAQ